MENLLYKLRQSRISITVVDDQLRLNIPHDLDATEIVKEVRKNKQELISYIRNAREASGFETRKPEPVKRQQSYDVSHQQKKEYLRFLILGDHAFNMNFILPFEALDKKALEQAIKTLFDRHESLRTTFSQTDGQIRQHVHETGSFVINIEYIDLVNETDKQKIAERLFNEGIKRQFNFERVPLAEVKVAHYFEGAHFLLFTIHHVNCDAFSTEVLKREIRQLYDAYRTGSVNPLEPLKLQIKDYAHWVNDLLHSDRGRASAEFYKRTVAGSVCHEYGVPDRDSWPRSAIGSYKKDLQQELIKAGAEQKSSQYTAVYGTLVNLFPPMGAFYRTFVSGDLLDRIRKLAVDCQSSLFNILTAALAVTLYEASGNPYIRIYIPFSTRVFEEFEHIVGWLTSEIVLCIEVSRGATVRSFIQHVAGVVLETSNHRFYPHEKILDDLDLPLQVLAPAVMNLVNMTGNKIADFNPVHNNRGSGHFNLDCQVAEYDNGMMLDVNYKLSNYSSATIEILMNRYVDVLERMSRNPGADLIEE
ncbi:hypothetical protein KK083_01085 [Fulvivirgaceae bacterium PWU4]|uniref:Condensation domain-containing protein n=1 Tax=Chryseosolibacter histidini TaxID=2782349 RepID=A0AAP2DH14_9BACT|nr:condensation domain-containing protein [Chryseosolibacter histidini]MBT1695449.1 hypothetical protein [Chryseosolibacter histidini]